MKVKQLTAGRKCKSVHVLPVLTQSGSSFMSLFTEIKWAYMTSYSTSIDTISLSAIVWKKTNTSGSAITGNSLKIRICTCFGIVKVNQLIADRKGKFVHLLPVLSQTGSSIMSVYTDIKSEYITVYSTSIYTICLSATVWQKTNQTFQTNFRFLPNRK